jgi:hypothetical protein
LPVHAGKRQVIRALSRVLKAVQIDRGRRRISILPKGPIPSIKPSI